MALVLGPIIGKIGGKAATGYGAIVSGTVPMPREWSTVPWPETIGEWSFSGDYQIRSVLVTGGIATTAARILINGTPVHTTTATNPGRISHTLTIPSGATVEIQAFTDSATVSNRSLHPGSHVAIVPIA